MQLTATGELTEVQQAYLATLLTNASPRNMAIVLRILANAIEFKESNDRE